MVAEPFVWGRAGAKLTPDQIAKEREMAEALAKGAMDYSPVGHWSQGLGRVAQGLLAGLDYRNADAAEAENTTYNQGIIESLLGGAGGSPSSPVATASMPTATGAGQEMAATSPSVNAANIPMFANDGTELGSYLSDPAKRSMLPAGMRNNNPGNIKFVGQKVPGIVGPSVNTDQGDPQAVFDTPESGMKAMYSLLGRKYAGGKLTPNQMIAGNMGWTPGNYDAAKNVARTMGIGPDDDIGFSDPQRAAKFMQALILQEHGQKGRLYPESLLLSAVGGQPTQVASASPQSAMSALPAQNVPPAVAAIEAAAPASGYVDPVISAQGAPPQEMAAVSPQAMMQPDAPALPPPTEIAPPPSVAAMPQQQVAQALSPPSAAPQAQGINPAILRALSDPRAAPQTRAVAQALMQQEFQKQQAAEEMRMKQQDPLRQLQIQKAQIEVDSANKPQRQPLMNMGDGTVYDPNLPTEQRFIRNPNSGPEKTPDSVRALQERAKLAGLNPGTPEYNQFMISGGSGGTSLSVGPNGEINFSQGGAMKPLTEAQSKDSFFTTRMTGAVPTIDKFENALMSLPESVAGAIPMNLGRYAQSEEYQLAKDAGDDFVAAYLRKDSGAALTAEEKRQYSELLLPQPSDKPALIAAKKQRRQLAIEAIKSGMPSNAVDGVLRAIQAVPGADQPTQTTKEKKAVINGYQIEELPE